MGRPAPATSLDLKASAFDLKEKLWTKFPPEGTKHTPPHQSCDFRWKDYCPVVFRFVFLTMRNLRIIYLVLATLILICWRFKACNYDQFSCRTLRKLFKVDAADYMISICGNDALRELSSPGKSGSFFYLTNDDKYMIKTMKKSEVKVIKLYVASCSFYDISTTSFLIIKYFVGMLQVLLKMLPAYYNHVRAFENTLVTKFFGLHCVKLGATQKKVCNCRVPPTKSCFLSNYSYSLLIPIFR